MRKDCAVALNLSTEHQDRIFVVISHDCDLAERDITKEPHVEVIEAVLIPECDPNFTHSKSTRLLHISATKEGQQSFLELRANTKKSVDKVALEKFEPTTELELLGDDGKTLSHWLAARYKRAAFPNSLLGRLGKTIIDSLGKVGKKNPHTILGIFLDHDPEYELGDISELYELWIYIIYSHEIEGAAEAAKEIAIDLRQKFERQFLASGRDWQLVELRECEAVADTQFSIYEAKRLKFFRLDHLSLRESPTAEIPDIS